MDMNNNLNEALCEVRKAYRLLIAYQKRMLEITKKIQKHFKLKYYWFNNYEFDVRTNRNPTERWAIELLPLYTHSSMFFLKEEADNNYPKKNEFMLEIRFDNDSGFKKVNSREEPDPSNFANVVECESRVWLCAYGVKEDISNTNWLYNVYSKCYKMRLNNNNEDSEYWSYGKHYNLNEIYDDQSLNSVCEDFYAIIEEHLNK